MSASTVATTSVPPATGADDSATADAPFGLPVLAELPELAGMLTALADGDRLLVDAAVRLAELLDSDQVGSTGVPVEHWLGIVTSQTRMDRRLLLRLARLLRRLPALREAATRGEVSFAQLRGLAIACRGLPLTLDRQVDDYLAQALPRLVGADPDAIVGLVTRLIDELDPHELDRTQDGVRRRLHLQPWLDGTGGHVSGTLDAVGLAVLDEATAPTHAQLADPRPHDQLRADNLVDHLLHTCPDGSDADEGEADGGLHAIDGRGAEVTTQQLRVPRLRDDGSLPPVQLQVRIELASLLDRAATPAAMLTRLIGGRLRLSAQAARRLVDERGAELRAVIIDDDSNIVGVGRSRRHPPGWLRTTIQMSHDTCTGPLCDRPARGAHLDHAVPWHPARPDDPYGTTGVDNLGPLCAGPNRDKEAAGWRATQTCDGRRSWSHPATGLTITSVPTTWRPPGHRTSGGSAPATAVPDNGDPPHPAGTDPPDSDPLRF